MLSGIESMKMMLINIFPLLILSVSIHSKSDNSSLENGDLNRFITFAGARFDVRENGKSPNRYIWLHGDEQTARMALEHHITKYHGIAFFIASKTREVPFKKTIIDPNRIFSRNGAYHALRKFKPDWGSLVLEQALDDLDEERKVFLDILMPAQGGKLISVHNNFRGYNVYKEEERSQKISIKKDQNPRDFIICTHIDDYKILALSPFNVVLQNLPPEKDDGSLSWEALRRNVRYFNIEARLGYLTQQKKNVRVY